MSNPFIQPITILGETRGRGPAKRFGIHQADRLFHTYIIGQTGTGKSTLLLNMLKQDAEQNRGFCLIDPHGDLAHAAKDRLPLNGIYTRVDTPEPQRRPYFLYADEFHSFTTEAFAGMLSELRKYRLGLILAHQHTSQVSTPVLDGIFGNVGTVLVFRIGANDAPLIARQLGLENSSDLLNQTNFQMNVKLMIDGEVSTVFTAETVR